MTQWWKTTWRAGKCMISVERNSADMVACMVPTHAPAGVVGANFYEDTFHQRKAPLWSAKPLVGLKPMIKHLFHNWVPYINFTWLRGPGIALNSTSSDECNCCLNEWTLPWPVLINKGGEESTCTMKIYKRQEETVNDILISYFPHFTLFSVLHTTLFSAHHAISIW